MNAFQIIIEGKPQEIPDYSEKQIAKRIICKDGLVLSVQASRTHYCTPRTNHGPYSHVEVGYPTVTPPKSWRRYADGDYPNDVYACVPVELVATFIDSHGGIKE